MFHNDWIAWHNDRKVWDGLRVFLLWCSTGCSVLCIVTIFVFVAVRDSYFLVVFSSLLGAQVSYMGTKLLMRACSEIAFEAIVIRFSWRHLQKRLLSQTPREGVLLGCCLDVLMHLPSSKPDVRCYSQGWLRCAGDEEAGSARANHRLGTYKTSRL